MPVTWAATGVANTKESDVRVDVTVRVTIRDQVLELTAQEARELVRLLRQAFGEYEPITLPPLPQPEPLPWPNPWKPTLGWPYIATSESTNQITIRRKDVDDASWPDKETCRG